jgi:peptidoglycan/LPS O-acetylase OafA/YrhL
LLPPTIHIKPASTWFKGLNALRFFAASLVVLMHVQSNLKIHQLPHYLDYPIQSKGLWAVSFFFVLSGFLITYLLFVENNKSNTINVKDFYLRRVFRIWPLYFLVIILGLLFYWKLAPMLHFEYPTHYSLGVAAGLYIFFMANVMNSLFDVGGIIHVTWSIAVEEQFYLFWAPFVKRIKNNFIPITISISLFFLIINALNTLHVFPVSEKIQILIRTLQFHYMGIGALSAWLLFNKKETLLNNFVFTSKIIQAIFTIVIVIFFLGYSKTDWGEVLLPLPIGVLLAWLILNLGVNENRIFSLDNTILNYLGDISYGIYMLHVPIIYANTLLYQKLLSNHQNSFWYLPSYYILLFAAIILAASFSYKFIEQPILAVHKKIKNAKPK